MRNVYLDYNATTPVHPEVAGAMLPFLRERFGNPSSVHAFGQDAKQALDDARRTVASALGAKADEITFTSGATEADNLAVTGVASALCEKGRHIITSKIEHHAVLAPCEHLARIGFEITEVPCDSSGVVDPADVKKAVRKDTTLITIMHVNNEIGTIQPIVEIGKIARERGIVFHTDAVQSVGKLPLDMNTMNVNLLSLSAHKIYGPKGVGVLYVKRGTPLTPLVFGGSHERKRRAGTENLPGIVGLAKAVEIVTQDVEARNAGMLALRSKLEEGIKSSISHVRLNGHSTKRVSSTSNVSFEFIEGESLLLSLDMEGVAVSSGSACTSGSLEPSHVLIAMGVPPEIAQGSLRISLGRDTTEDDIDYVLEILPATVEKLRSMSPLFKKSSAGVKGS
ncbi:MAG: cysteine desulfurase [Latescibacteria bacterium DG_63]|nr:MAG: cysteine desulfurase [Latescibacteria bacterium DG_63]